MIAQCKSLNLRAEVSSLIIKLQTIKIIIIEIFTNKNISQFIKSFASRISQYGLLEKLKALVSLCTSDVGLLVVGSQVDQPVEQNDEEQSFCLL